MGRREKMKILIAFLSLAACSKALECEECIEGMGLYPDAILSLGDALNETLYTKYCHQPDDPCYIDQFINDWLPPVLTEFVAGQGETVCSNLGLCGVIRSVTCEECLNTLHALARWLESEEQIVLHVAFLQAGLCAGDEECGSRVADNYPDLMKHTAQNFIVAFADDVLCFNFCQTTPTEAPATAAI